MPPFRKSTSVGRRASTSCSIDALWPYATSGFAAWSISSSGSASSTIPCAAATALPSSTSPRDERGSVGSLADAAVGEAGQRADRVRRRVEDHLAPLRRTRVGDRGGRHPGPRARVGEPRDLVGAAGLRLERAERRVALHVPLHVAGLEQLAGREGRAADHARGRAPRSPPRCRRRSAPRRQRRRRTRAPWPRSPRPCASPSWRRCRSRRRGARRVGGRPRAADDLARSGQPQPVRR